MGSQAGGSTAAWINQNTGQPAEHDGWYRGHHSNLHPCKSQPANPSELAAFIDKYAMTSLIPDSPFITKNDFITAFGSCFAYNVEHFLWKNGYRTATRNFSQNTWSESLIVQCPDGFVNTAAIRHQFDWIFNDQLPDFSVWRKIEGEIKEYLETNRPGARALMDETTVFVITVGLSEVWYNKQDGKVLFSPVPGRVYDPQLHGVRSLSAQENHANLHEIVTLIRSVYSEKPIIFTLSPVPLLATYKETSCTVSNSVSKAALRIALDELCKEFTPDDQVYYFPSYEIVTELFRDPWHEDRRHPSSDVVEAIMQTFVRHYAIGWSGH